MKNYLYNVADGPDWAERVLAVIDLSPELKQRLLRLRNARNTLMQFEHVGKDLYAIEIFDYTPDIVFGRFYKDVGEEDEDDGADIEGWVACAPGFKLREPEELPYETPRCEAVTILVLDDGVKWTWYEKGANDAYSTQILFWKDIDDEGVEKCEKCGTPFSQASIDGGRCLGSDQEGRFCGTMIVGVPA